MGEKAWLLCLIALVSFSVCRGQYFDGNLGRKHIKTKGSAGFFVLEKGNFYINLTNWGATLVSVKTPDVKGHVGDILLGYDHLASYMIISSSRPYFGAIMGRVANRIKNAQFILDGKKYHLPANEGNNTLHGGRRGFDNVLWEVKEIRGGKKPYIKFHYHSFDGEEGFPGELDAFATYTISGETELTLKMEAIPRNKPTPVNLVTHAYWNLAGHNSRRNILDHSVQIWASHYTPTDKAMIPTGQILPVKGTPLDFTKEATIGSRINKVPSTEHPPGFDNNYVLDSPKSKEMQGLRVAARAKDPWSSRVLEVWTSAPGMQFYTSNNLKDPVGKGGVVYKPHSSFCFETQDFPNAVNQPNFPSVIVRPGQVYKHTMVFKFSVEK
uniref:Aldose 1-epimerase n=1 Tax=Araucaria cunninghamii TaxID=56994 RepID=A0A0D6QTR3_ARACU